jgi:hypothetical protein
MKSFKMRPSIFEMTIMMSNEGRPRHHRGIDDCLPLTNGSCSLLLVESDITDNVVSRSRCCSRINLVDVTRRDNIAFTSMTFSTMLSLVVDNHHRSSCVSTTTQLHLSDMSLEPEMIALVHLRPRRFVIDNNLLHHCFYRSTKRLSTMTSAITTTTTKQHEGDTPAVYLVECSLFASSQFSGEPIRMRPKIEANRH